MTHNLLQQRGIAALACSATDNASLLPCTFQVKYHEARLHATYSLQHTTHVHNFPEARPFTFLYDADNLSPATTTCKTATRTLSQTQLQHVARNRITDVHALSLTLRKPAAILCPDFQGSVAPKASHEISFRQLVEFAKSTEITILFDWKRLHPRQQSLFLIVVSQPERLSGFPIDQKNLRGRRLVNWSVFSPTEDHISNEPPPYADVSRKRTLQSE